MTFFYFHLSEGGRVTEDIEGHELPDLDAARTMAIAAARSLMCHEMSTGKLCFECHIDIAGSNGRRLQRVEFSEAV